MKTIQYAGKEYTVPNWVKYVTQDWNMEICGWCTRPDYSERLGFWGYLGDREFKHVVLENPQTNPAASKSLKEV